MTQYATTITFEAGSTTIVTDFTIQGVAGNLTTINSSIPGTQFTLYKNSGTVNASYLSIQDSNATGGATWNANDGTDVDLGNNTGWNFTTPPATSQVGGQFMAFFF